MKKILVLLLFTGTVCAGAFETYVSDAELVNELNRLYNRAGVVFPTASYPVDAQELYTYALQLRRSSDRRQVRSGVDQFLERLDFAPDEKEVVSEERISYEHYLRGNAEYQKEIDFYRSYIEAAPFFFWALSAGSDGGTGLHVSMELERQNDPDMYPSNNLYKSVDGNPIAIENYFLSTGYVAHRSDDWLLQFGRTPMHFGGNGFSSFLPSDRLPFMDAFYYTWSFGPLKMSSFVSSLYNNAGGDEIQDMKDASLPNIDPGKLENGIIEYLPGGGNEWVAFDKTMILTAMHRFEWAFRKLRLGITSLHVSSRENNDFHIGDMFPVFSWHNGEVGVHNMSLVLEASLVPFSGLELFAQAGYDDINAEDISGVGDTSIPTISAYLAGAKYSHAIGSSILSYLLESGYTHYLWGNFHEFDPERGNYLSRAIYRYLRDEETVLLPLTSPYGPGTAWIRGNINLQTDSAWRVALRTETVFKNTQADLVTTAYEEASTVENGSMELWGFYGVRVDYGTHFQKNNRLSVYLQPALLVRDTEMWPELMLGGSIEMTHRTLLNK